METCTLPCVKYIGSGNLLCDARSSNPMLCDKLEGWDGVRDGNEVQEGGDICILRAHFRVYIFFKLFIFGCAECRLSLVAEILGYFLVEVCRLLIARASLGAEHGL